VNQVLMPCCTSDLKALVQGSDKHNRALTATPSTGVAAAFQERLLAAAASSVQVGP
jgi:hypothetical protein